VFGGHSLIVDVKDFEDYEIIGQSLDDAVGEAFDKSWKATSVAISRRSPYRGSSKKW
jgi:Metal-dependent proteases with possible chaperone activity